jgi:hypothetical protein
MNMEIATRLVGEDTRQSYPDMTDAEAVEHAQYTLVEDDIYGDDELAEAYRFVLAAQGE